VKNVILKVGIPVPQDVHAFLLIRGFGYSKNRASEETGLSIYLINKALERDDLNEMLHRTTQGIIQQLLAGLTPETFRELVKSDEAASRD
jgi:hypothetical protein